MDQLRNIFRELGHGFMELTGISNGDIMHLVTGVLIIGLIIGVVSSISNGSGY